MSDNENSIEIEDNKENIEKYLIWYKNIPKLYEKMNIQTLLYSSCSVCWLYNNSKTNFKRLIVSSKEEFYNKNHEITPISQLIVLRVFDKEFHNNDNEKNEEYLVENTLNYGNKWMKIENKILLDQLCTKIYSFPLNSNQSNFQFKDIFENIINSTEENNFEYENIEFNNLIFVVMANKEIHLYLDYNQTIEENNDKCTNYNLKYFNRLIIPDIFNSNVHSITAIEFDTNKFSIFVASSNNIIYKFDLLDKENKTNCKNKSQNNNTELNIFEYLKTENDEEPAIFPTELVYNSNSFFTYRGLNDLSLSKKTENVIFSCGNNRQISA